MKTVYIIKATFEIEVDPAKTETVTKAAQWIEKLQTGSVIAMPEGLEATVTVQPPTIKNKR